MHIARNGRVPGEPTYEELQIRIRKWLQWYWRTQWKPANRTKVELASLMHFTKTTVGNLINGKELPGLECYMRMHWRLHLDAYKMLHADPDGEVLPLPLPTPAQKKLPAKKPAPGARG